MLWGLQLMVLAGALVAFSNFFMRKSIDAGGSSKGFLLIQLTFTFFVAILLNPVRSGNFNFSPETASMGLFAGVVLGLMMMSLGKALENGPAGLTVAILNASTVFPILGMVLMFGEDYGFTYTALNAVGSIIVVAGLIWAGFQTIKGGSMGKWLFFAVSGFALHIIFLMMLQWRSVLINFPGHSYLFSKASPESLSSQWFMPMVFFAAASIQLIVYLRQQVRAPLPQEINFGLLGGAANGLGTFFLIRSTEIATSVEQAMIFPLYAVTMVLVCNLWGRFLYKEHVHWKATATALGGLVVGTIDWATLFS